MSNELNGVLIGFTEREAILANISFRGDRFSVSFDQVEPVIADRMYDIDIFIESARTIIEDTGFEGVYDYDAGPFLLEEDLKPSEYMDFVRENMTEFIERYGYDYEEGREGRSDEDVENEIIDSEEAMLEDWKTYAAETPIGQLVVEKDAKPSEMEDVLGQRLYEHSAHGHIHGMVIDNSLYPEEFDINDHLIMFDSIGAGQYDARGDLQRSLPLTDELFELWDEYHLKDISMIPEDDITRINNLMEELSGRDTDGIIKDFTEERLDDLREL